MKKRIKTFFELVNIYSWWSYLLIWSLVLLLVCALGFSVSLFGDPLRQSWLESPLLCILLFCLIFIGSGLTWFQRHKKNLLSRQHAIINLNSMEFKSFCRFIIQRFSFMGYTFVSQTYDKRNVSCLVKLIKNGDMSLVMIHRGDKIKRRQVLDLADLKFTEGIDRGIYVTTGIYQPLAAYFSRRSYIELIDGKTLMIFLGKHIDDKCLLTADHGDNSSGLSLITRWIESHKPVCPYCQSPLIMKLQRSNGQPGQAYWECALHPQCNGIFNYEIDHPAIT